MTLHREQYAQLWIPLAVELGKALITLIFGTKKKKAGIVEQFLPVKEYEDEDNYDHNNGAGYHNSSLGFRW